MSLPSNVAIKSEPDVPLVSSLPEVKILIAALGKLVVVSVPNGSPIVAASVALRPCCLPMYPCLRNARRERAVVIDQRAALDIRKVYGFHTRHDLGEANRQVVGSW